ncbi:hypothetical protein PHAVU_010G065000 [Phaseolus vulgaris]|uniref:Uncharacterized protein n=1 Tax=Phaseolus vulgaris TaxID=3885 RepID=V7APX9_PHAVU|nr:hypothetical protein PHAVU_010G065000g [Phaseolus vulgaris]ESW06643.1 hypothetical protein PHAVU_010G065000g [Phaseolus vulgaris]
MQKGIVLDNARLFVVMAAAGAASLRCYQFWTMGRGVTWWSPSLLLWSSWRHKFDLLWTIVSRFRLVLVRWWIIKPL